MLFTFSCDWIHRGVTVFIHISILTEHQNKSFLLSHNTTTAILYASRYVFFGIVVFAYCDLYRAQIRKREIELN